MMLESDTLPHCVRRYLDEAVSAGDSAARERLERVAEVLISERCRSFEDCIAWARRLFEVGPGPRGLACHCVSQDS